MFCSTFEQILSKFWTIVQSSNKFQIFKQMSDFRTDFVKFSDKSHIFELIFNLRLFSTDAK